MNNTIDKALGIIDDISENSSMKKISKSSATTSVGNNGNDIEYDYAYQRENFYNLIERGQDAIDGILEVAQNSDHPRAFEVAGNLISQVADVTEKLGKLQSAMKRLKEVPSNAPKNVTNALYVGSTAELQKLLKKDKEK